MKTDRDFKRNYKIYLISIVFGLIGSSIALADVVKDYLDFCVDCHGKSGDGKTQVIAGLESKPRDFTIPGLNEVLSEAAMIDAVSNGRPGTAMTAWRTRLDKERIAALVTYIRTVLMSRSESIDDLSTDHPARQLYSDTCAICHGEDGGGTAWGRASLSTEPRNFLSAESTSSLNPGRIRFSIRNGRPGTAMVGFSGRLSEGQIAQLADYIWSELMQNALNKNTMTMVTGNMDTHQSASMPSGLEGNPQAGRVSYVKNCVDCHGASGGGDGPRSHFIRPPPRSFTQKKARAVFNRPGLFYGTKFGIEGKPMPAWGSVMDDQEIADIAEFMFREFIKPEKTEP